MLKLLAVAFSGITAATWATTHAGLTGRDGLNWLRQYSKAFKNIASVDGEKLENMEGLAINIKWQKGTYKSSENEWNRKDVLGSCLNGIKKKDGTKFWGFLGQNDWLEKTLSDLQNKVYKGKVEEIDGANWPETTKYVKKSFGENRWVKSLLMIFTSCSLEDNSYKQDWDEVKKMLEEISRDSWVGREWEDSEQTEKRKLRWLLAVNSSTEDPFASIKRSPNNEDWKIDKSEDCSWTPRGNQEYKFSFPQEVKLQYLLIENSSQCYVRAGKFMS